MEVIEPLVKSQYGYLTETDLENTINRYINTLRDPDDIYDIKTMYFYGLLRYIYKYNIQYVLPPEHTNHNYPLMDSIFYRVYLPICYHFKRVPSVHSFIIHLLDYDLNSIYDLRAGVYRGSGAKPNPDAARYVAKWEAVTTSDLLDYVVHSSSIGGMFRLKTKGFSEEQRITVNVASSAPTLDTQQLGALVQNEYLLPPETE